MIVNPLTKISPFFPVISFLFFASCVSLSEHETVKDELEQQRKKNAEIQEILKKHDEKLSKADEKLSEAYADRGSLIANNLLTEKEAQAQRDLIKRLKDSVYTRKFKLRLSGRRLILVLPADILFASGSASLSQTGSQAVEKITRVLIENSNCKYQVEGHTDNVPIHTPRFPSNWELAAFRALNVLHTMVAAGMPPDLVSSASFADTRPIKNNENEENRKANRRIEIALIPDLSALPLKSIPE